MTRILFPEHMAMDPEAESFISSCFMEIVQQLHLSDVERESLQDRIRQFPYPALMLLRLLEYNEKVGNKEALRAESFAYGVLQTGKDFYCWLEQKKPQQKADLSMENKDAPPVLLERNEENLFITLNRPYVRNAYSAAMRESLYEALQLLDADSSISRCDIRGAGNCFSVGGDLEEFGSSQDSAQSYAIRRMRNVAGLLLKNAQRIHCHVHRACIGSGIELPACAGQLVAAPNTFFQLPELSMGLIPGAGGTVSILRRIGRVRTAWWVLSGKKINAETALEWGLVDALE